MVESKVVSLGRCARFRPVTWDDEYRLFEWRTDARTIATSVMQSEVTPESHRLWMMQGVCDPRITRLIYEENAEPLGQVTVIQRRGAHHCPYQVAPKRRRRGVGFRMMELLYESIKGAKVACVRPDNAASVKILERNRFVPTAAGLLASYEFTVPDGLQGYFRGD